MKKLLVILMLGSVALADPPKGKQVQLKVPPLPPSTDDLLLADPAKAGWVPSEKMNLPPGAQLALIGQDPVTTGQTLYWKMSGGYKVPAHFYAHGVHLVFVRGKGAIGINGKSAALSAGSYVSLPPKTTLELACEAGAECLLVLDRRGPGDINWVKAAK
jgi:hypothetical protein